MAKRLTPADKARRTREKNARIRKRGEAKRIREAAKAAREAARLKREEEKAKRAARPLCVCGKKHQLPGKYWECEEKAKKLTCTCPPYWHRVHKDGRRWLSHSQSEGCPLSGSANAEKAAAYNLATFGVATYADLPAIETVRPLEQVPDVIIGEPNGRKRPNKVRRKTG